MPTLKISLQTLTDVLGLSDVEFNIAGAKMLQEGFIDLEVVDLTNTLQSPDAIVQVNFAQRAIIGTLTAAPPVKLEIRDFMLWYRYNEERKVWEFNHYSDGWVADATRPEPPTPDHVKMWKKGKWAYAFAQLQMGRIPKVINAADMVICQ